MIQVTALRGCGGRPREISILAVVTPEHSAEIQRIVSHTRWQSRVVPSIREALQALEASPVSVVLCEDQLPDGYWLDIVRETERLCPRPRIIVLSSRVDSALWAEVVACGGYDVLSIPLDPREVYTIIPMAWRQRVCNTRESPSAPREKFSNAGWYKVV